MTTTEKIREHFRKNPDADVKKAAAKFKTAVARIYKLRAEVRGPEAAEAPKATRKRRPRKIVLTASQVIVANKLGIPLDRYAQELRKLKGKKWMPPEPLPVPEPPTWTATQESGNIIATLNERALDYGKFKDGAALMQGIKRLLADHAQRHDKTFADDQWEALEMIVHKIGRIVNGNPDKVDHWTDIAGYAKLVADRLEGVER